MTMPSPRIQVRPASLEDVPSAYAIEVDSFRTDQLSMRGLHRHFQSATADAFVAVASKEVVGYALLLYRRGSTIARLYSIATRRDTRRQGVGDRLMGACEQGAARRGCNRLRLEVREDNGSAARLYQRLGYAKFGRIPGYYADGAAAVRLEKQLPASGRGASRVLKRVAV